MRLMQPRMPNWTVLIMEDRLHLIVNKKCQNSILRGGKLISAFSIHPEKIRYNTRIYLSSYSNWSKKILIFNNPLTTINDLQEFQRVEQVLAYYIQRNSYGTLTFQLIIG